MVRTKKPHRPIFKPPWSAIKPKPFRVAVPDAARAARARETLPSSRLVVDINRISRPIRGHLAHKFGHVWNQWNDRTNAFYAPVRRMPSPKTGASVFTSLRRLPGKITEAYAYREYRAFCPRLVAVLAPSPDP